MTSPTPTDTGKKPVELKHVEPGWLARSIVESEIWYAANKEWADRVVANWIAEPPTGLAALPKDNHHG